MGVERAGSGASASALPARWYSGTSRFNAQSANRGTLRQSTAGSERHRCSRDFGAAGRTGGGRSGDFLGGEDVFKAKCVGERYSQFPCSRAWTPEQPGTQHGGEVEKVSFTGFSETTFKKQYCSNFRCQWDWNSFSEELNCFSHLRSTCRCLCWFPKIKPQVPNW